MRVCWQGAERNLFVQVDTSNKSYVENEYTRY
jgi:hypothetical protein